MRYFSYMLILTGVVLLSYGAYQWYGSESAQRKSLSEAENLLHSETSVTAESFRPETGETIGILHIPSLEAELPIVEGTDPEELEKGVGHFRHSAYPLQDNQIVLSGHRDTVFRRTGELEIGDVLILQLPYGDFSYEISGTRIVSADDRTVIVPHDKEVLTLTTCYPFSFIGSAPDRYIITAQPIHGQNAN